ncbi:MAG TPA: PQQ-dependent dehydrogenase, methanol/ethanol family [Bryobacteraceae bacterium]|nr:PQQ-dependent dehydrogenase, methanol/ethanol family [Bryobacteraceae bacterium]
MKGIGIAVLAAMSLAGQVSYQRLLNSENEPGNWMTYSGGYASHRYSRLDQITSANVGRLKLKWAFQMKTLETVETTPLVVDGIMYLTQPPNDVFALDAETGRPYWNYRRSLPEHINVCCGQVNRGLAILGDRLFMGTVDAHLVALDRKTGNLAWDVVVADPTKGYSVTAAPLVVKDKIIVGISGGEYGIRGFLDAYDPSTGKRLWRFYTIPGPGEPGHETWSGDSWKTGGAPTWVTGSFDPKLNLIYWGTGNAAPDWNGDARLGDNLYSSSVIALDADTGRLKWYFQFSPHDVHDWDAVQIPVLVDAEFRGRARRLMYWGNRNAFFYVLDRETGEFLLAKPFTTQTWAERIDEKGRPVARPHSDPTREGNVISPGPEGGTNWYSPSYSPRTRLFYLSVWDFANKYYTGDALYQPGTHFFGSVPEFLRDDPGSGAVKAVDPATGEIRWQYKLHTMPQAGLLSTAGNLLFGGSDKGYFFALDAATGKELWRAGTGGLIAAGPVSYLSKGKQLVSIAAGSAIFTFGLE